MPPERGPASERVHLLSPLTQQLASHNTTNRTHPQSGKVESLLTAEESKQQLGFRVGTETFNRLERVEIMAMEYPDLGGGKFAFRNQFLGNDSKGELSPQQALRRRY